jgi:hypothetical protein
MNVGYSAPEDDRQWTRPVAHSASSGHGMMVDFTVFIAIASATARRYVILEALLCGDRR